jgi:outer membrane protein assembly factor BamD
MLVGCNTTGAAPAPASKRTKALDDAYVALRSQNEHSPRLPGMIVRLIRAHIDAHEYLLARFYCDEYRRDFPSGKERPQVEYLGIRALYLRYEREHDDRLAQQAESEIDAFLSMFPRSAYRTKVIALRQEMRRDQKARYKALAEYYAKKGKPKAAQFYRDKIVH